ncbi:hypothetical protein VNI00_018684 [Paramarasmius palmivorus]|uniref:F-box domain-containing protein n=1 Tax=Paramarasmius palmivorus TaxID=297713 RepID=A0AAW0AX14_9AGAR
MSRSKTTPLDLSIYIAGCSVPGVRSIWRLLAESSERWQNLRLAAPREVLLMDNLLEEVAGRLASLKYLALSEEEDDIFTPPFSALIQSFKTCPSLDTIVLENLNPDNLVLPYHQIKSLTLQDSTVGENLWSLFPTLEEIVIRDSWYPFHPAQEHTSLSEVRKLEIISWKTDPGDNFFTPFRALTLPQLSSLHISYLNVMALDDDSRKSFDEQALTSFLTRSRCSITELILTCAPISDVQAIRLLGLMPTLRSLHIEEYPGRPNGVPNNMIITSTFLKAISVTMETAPLAPSLSELTLVLHPSALGFNCQELVEALSSRCLCISTAVHGLSSADIGFIGPEEVNPWIIQQLSGARAEGKFGSGFHMRIRRIR